MARGALSALGGRGRGHAEQWEGKVGRRRSGSPHLTPTLSGPGAEREVKASGRDGRRQHGLAILPFWCAMDVGAMSPPNSGTIQ